MNVQQYNDLCLEWHRGKKELRLGQFLMNNLEVDKFDPDIFYCTDSKMASTMFFNRHVHTSENSPHSKPDLSTYRT